MIKWLQGAGMYFLHFISYLPLAVLYLLSDFLKFVILPIVGYRKTVVRENLQQSFPNKTKAEIQRLQSQFYGFFSDLLVENVKSFTISKKRLEKSVHFSNLQLIEKYAKQRQPIILVMGHYGNWELIGLAGFQLPSVSYSLYRKQKNNVVNKFIVKNRQRYGLRLIEEKEAIRKIPQLLSEQNANIVTFITDQSVRPNRAYWINFLHRDATFAKGAETYARKYNCPVVYMDIQVPKRGHYLAQFNLLSDQPAQLPESELTKQFASSLEKTIQDQPQYWLWSHRRWKHQKGNGS